MHNIKNRIRIAIYLASVFDISPLAPARSVN